MSTANVIALFAVCVPVVLSVTGAAVRICSKLEKISSALANMMTRAECSELRKNCPALLLPPVRKSQRKSSAASLSPAAAARRRISKARL
jgi:hypothetical protein